MTGCLDTLVRVNLFVVAHPCSVELVVPHYHASHCSLIADCLTLTSCTVLAVPFYSLREVQQLSAKIQLAYPLVGCVCVCVWRGGGVQFSPNPGSCMTLPFCSPTPCLLFPFLQAIPFARMPWLPEQWKQHREAGCGLPLSIRRPLDLHGLPSCGGVPGRPGQHRHRPGAATCPTGPAGVHHLVANHEPRHQRWSWDFPAGKRPLSRR